MDELLYILYFVLDFIFGLSYFIIFYISIKKCFIREGKSKIKLVLLLIFTNPPLIFVVSIFSFYLLSGLIYSQKNSLGFNTALNIIGENVSFSVTATIICGVLYVALSILFSYLIGKWLEVYNLSLVTYVYMMFAVIYALSGGRSVSDSETFLISSNGLNILSEVIMLFSIFSLYFFVIKHLIKLTDRKYQINWKIFVIPPSLFLMGYYVFDYMTFSFCSSDANLVLQILSKTILLLFLWAFYVIIKNIGATNDALEANDEVKELSVEIMIALAKTIDAKDKYTNGHSIRVAQYSKMIAERMELSEKMCEDIYYMGLLHDIGKIGVPNEIINKPAKLTDEEYSIIKTHPEIGYQILSEIKSRPELAKGARWHHERYDGKGYPDRKAGEEIPIEARIIAVADSYDAMTSNRSYRDYLPQDVVREEIEKNIGTQFDEEAARCMLTIIDEDEGYLLHEQ